MNTFTFQKILFATDFSACSEAPRRFAVFLARKYKAELIVIHITERAAVGIPAFFDNVSVASLYDQVRGNIETHMNNLFSEKERKNISITEIVEQGNTVERIADCAKETQTDLIVMGTHGRLGIHHAIMGSVAEKIVRTVQCPVLTVRSTKKQPRIRNILFTTDFSEYSFIALPHVLNIAKKFNAKLHQMYVIEPFTYDPANPDQHFPNERLLEYVENSAHDLFQTLNQETENGIAISQEITCGLSPHLEILSYIDKNHIDLIVMATHGRSGLKHMLLGSTTERVVRLSPCPVLSVKAVISTKNYKQQMSKFD